MAWEYFNGPFDFNKTPLAPVGCKVLIHAKPGTCRSWDYRAKQGFYVGPVLNHYRCYKLVKSETKQKVISNTVQFRHAYLQIPAVSAEDKILNGLQVMVGAMQNAPPPTTSSQLVAIKVLHALLEKWQLLAPPALLQYSRAPRLPWPSPTPQRSTPPTPIATQDRTNNPFHALKQDNCEEDVPSAPPWSPPPLPASVPCPPDPALRLSRFLEATPTRLVFEATPTPTSQQPLLPPLPRMSPPPSAGPQHIPVAHRTRARLAAPQLSSLVELVQYHVPTAKTTRPQATMSNHFTSLCKALTLSKLEVIEFAGFCESLTILNDGDALAVLDRDTGKLLEHCQLRKDPCYKTVWDRSYANELGRLCQGVGTGDKAGGKWVAGIPTLSTS